MDALSREAALEERLLSAGEEDAAAPSTNFGDGRRGDAVFYGDARGGQLQVDGAAGKAAEGDAAHPCVAGVVDKDAVPAMVFVFRVPVAGLGFDGEVFDATFGEFAEVLGGDDVGSPLRGEGGGDKYNKLRRSAFLYRH